MQSRLISASEALEMVRSGSTPTKDKKRLCRQLVLLVACSGLSPQVALEYYRALDSLKHTAAEAGAIGQVIGREIQIPGFIALDTEDIVLQSYEGDLLERMISEEMVIDPGSLTFDEIDGHVFVGRRTSNKSFDGWLLRKIHKHVYVVNSPRAEYSTTKKRGGFVI